MLAYLDFTKPFKLHIDACNRGLGAILYQEQADGKEKPISFASRSLNKAESNYPAHKLEFLALKWAVMKRFHGYLYGNDYSLHQQQSSHIHINYCQVGCHQLMLTQMLSLESPGIGSRLWNLKL